METKRAIENRRSIRKFFPDSVTAEQLLELVRLGRLYSSAINAQPISFAAVLQKENCDKVFECLRWAGRVKDFSIAPEERPAAYLILLRDEKGSPFFEFDAGAAATTVMLAAEELGLSSCCLKIAFPEKLAQAIDFGGYFPVYAIALGEPRLKSTVVDRNDDPVYYVDEAGNFFVPKRTVDNVLVWSDL